MGPSSISIGKAAKILGVPVSTLRDWEKQGHITSAKTPGNHRRFRLEDVEAYKNSVHCSSQNRGQTRELRVVTDVKVRNGRLMVTHGTLVIDDEGRVSLNEKIFEWEGE